MKESIAAQLARSARRLVRPVRGEILDLLRQLVRTNSVALPPDGNEAAAQKVLARFLRDRGLRPELYDTAFLLRSKHPYVRRDRHYAGRPNLMLRLDGLRRGRSLLLTGHIDTVPPNPRSTGGAPVSRKGSPRRIPAAGDEMPAPRRAAASTGRVCGRGSWDMKGGLAAQFGVALALRRAGARLAGDLLCESVVDEEWAGAGGTLAGRLRGDLADACAIPEPTNLEVFRATRGGHFFEITVRAGDPSRYFATEEVVSPAIALGRILGWVDSWAQRRRRIRRGAAYADFPDPAPVQVLALEANRFDPGVPWSVPLAGRVRLYFQFLPHEDVPAVVGEINRSFREFCRADPFLRRHPLEVRPIVDPPLMGHELPANHEWTRCLATCAGAVLGRPAAISAAPYPCDAFLIQREFGVPTLLFGPCGAGAHNVGEYVTAASVLRTTEVLLAAALAWCG